MATTHLFMILFFYLQNSEKFVKENYEETLKYVFQTLYKI